MCFPAKDLFHAVALQAVEARQHSTGVGWKGSSRDLGCHLGEDQHGFQKSLKSWKSLKETL